MTKLVIYLLITLVQANLKKAQIKRIKVQMLLRKVQMLLEKKNPTDKALIARQKH